MTRLLLIVAIIGLSGCMALTRNVYKVGCIREDAKVIAVYDQPATVAILDMTYWQLYPAKVVSEGKKALVLPQGTKSAYLVDLEHTGNIKLLPSEFGKFLSEPQLLALTQGMPRSPKSIDLGADQ